MTSSHERIFYILNQSVVVKAESYLANSFHLLSGSAHVCPKFSSLQDLLGTCVRVISHADTFRNVAMCLLGGNASAQMYLLIFRIM